MDNKQNNRMCNGDCSKCSFQQRVYCASYMSRNNYAMVESVLLKIDSMLNEMDSMKQKISAIQSSEGELIRPFSEEEEETSVFEEESTMKASGAEK